MLQVSIGNNSLASREIYLKKNILISLQVKISHRIIYFYANIVNKLNELHHAIFLHVFKSKLYLFFGNFTTVNN